MFEKTALALDSECSASLELETCLELAQEAAHLSCTYDEVLISVADCIPYTWVCLMQVTGVTMDTFSPYSRVIASVSILTATVPQVKREHYRALADYYVALPLATTGPALQLTARAAETFQVRGHTAFKVFEKKC